MSASTCPRCASTLQQMVSPFAARTVLVDQCKDCGGVWLDGPEIAPVAPTLAHFLERRLSARTASHVTDGGIGTCPACEAATVQIDGCGVRIDACPACAGAWLDGGELAAVRRYAGANRTTRAAMDAAIGSGPTVKDGVVCTVCQGLVERKTTWMTSQGVVCEYCYRPMTTDGMREPAETPERTVEEKLAGSIENVGVELLFEGVFAIFEAVLKGG